MCNKYGWNISPSPPVLSIRINSEMRHRSHCKLVIGWWSCPCTGSRPFAKNVFCRTKSTFTRVHTGTHKTHHYKHCRLYLLRKLSEWKLGNLHKKQLKWRIATRKANNSRARPCLSPNTENQMEEHAPFIFCKSIKHKHNTFIIKWQFEISLLLVSALALSLVSPNAFFFLSLSFSFPERCRGREKHLNFLDWLV